MLQTLANLGQVLGAIAVVAAIVFGLAQIRQFRQQRREGLAVELMRSIQDTEFTRSLRVLLALPESAPAEELGAQPDLEDAAWAIGAKCETIGYPVFRGIMPIELVGGAGRRCGRAPVEPAPAVGALCPEGAGAAAPAGVVPMAG